MVEASKTRHIDESMCLVFFWRLTEFMVKNLGFIMLWRKALNWEWYKNIPVKVLFFHILLIANHSNQRWEGIEVKAGETITSIQHLAEESGVSIQQVRTALEKLEKTKEIQVESTNRYSKIKIINWGKYQGIYSPNNIIVTNEKQLNHKPLPTNNNANIVNNVDNVSKHFLKPTLEELKEYCRHELINIDTETFFDYYEARGWMMGQCPMQNWKAAIKLWSKKDKEFNKISESKRNYDGIEDLLEKHMYEVPEFED